MNHPTWTVYYQRGGTQNFTWNRVGECYTSADAARKSRDDLVKMGYPAHYERTEILDSIGLPEDYESR